ncbi:hypothetical protein [Methanobrevibacter sp.]|uniref:hypothetical protein n=1 Tax=Methanobrevibacter sp. TaxID=66852 RepID=UPI003890718F
MPKKVKDLTLREIEDICYKHHNGDDCSSDCPFYDNASACWIACALTDDEEINQQAEELNREIEAGD